MTIDADTVIHPDALADVDRLVRSGAFVGGGCGIVMERNSLGLAVTVILMRSVMTLSRSGAVMFWCRRENFDAIGGFDETLRIAEDLDFARRLRRHGRTTNRRFRNVRSAPATVCVRTWDRFGDWHYFTRVSAAAMRARSPRASDVCLIDEYFYDFNASAIGLVMLRATNSRTPRRAVSCMDRVRHERAPGWVVTGRLQSASAGTATAPSR